MRSPAVPSSLPPHRSRLSFRTPEGFGFRRTVYSHGWSELPPFANDPARRTLERTLELSGGPIAACTLRESARGVTVSAATAMPLPAGARREIIRQLRSCLRLDEDFSSFYAEADRHPGYRWIRRAGAGRMLRAPTAFEDAVKILCTTNCTWALTKIMVSGIVRTAGRSDDGVHFTFPGPAAVAALSERDLRVRCTTGYRAPFIRELALRVASGELGIEQWRTSALPTEELEREIRSVKGMGPYAAGNMLRLAGRCDSLALDSWVRAQYCRIHGRGRTVKDSVIEKHYEPYGTWRGLFFWLEMTRSWHDEKFKP